MDEFEQSDLEKETNDSHNTCHQNAICYKENAFIRNVNMAYFLLSLWSVGLKKADKGMKA